MENERCYICIDLKSFYASVECVDRGLNPLTTNLVVADASRTEKTICLAVSPSLKSFGIPGRPRLFEVVQKVDEVNKARRKEINNKPFRGESYDLPTLNTDPFMRVSYIVAPPRMAKYVEISTKIYDIYLKYVSPEDMHVYSIDEVFIDLTNYLNMYKQTAHQLAMTMIRDVLSATGITATVGIGTNLYLAKIAMDIVAKKMPADKDGVRIAELDEKSYRTSLWAHEPLTDFWRVGGGYVKRLKELGLYTMGDIARCSLGGKNDYHNEALLYDEFGINAELLIDHAWGYEPTLISDIKSYIPSANSLSEGQVLERPYTSAEAKIVVKEMVGALMLNIVAKGLVTNLISLSVGYDIENLTDKKISAAYKGEVSIDRYGRKVPKSVHSSVNLGEYTSSVQKAESAVDKLYDRLVDLKLLVRRIVVAANTFLASDAEKKLDSYSQISLFDTPKDEKTEKKDEKVSKSVLKIQGKYGKDAILKGTSLEKGATQRKRNKQIGGHKA